jgi:hypothetical protein
MFEVTRNSGFKMTFDNGWTVSVQWGNGNYCQNKYKTPENLHDFYNGRSREFVECKDAEVAVWDGAGVWFRLGEGDDVIGWVSPDRVAQILTQVAQFPRVYKGIETTEPKLLTE